ncbi:TPA: hypothetical protein MJA52_004238 [Klebsiella aerogenes]|nr:hypothetical protein [Klebsiella aerogenes]
MTLDELMADIHEHFPGEDAPSRSALGRYDHTYNMGLGSNGTVNAVKWSF